MALDNPSGGSYRCSYATNVGTNDSLAAASKPQLIEELGGRQGIRTPGLLVANEALSQLS